MAAQNGTLVSLLVKRAGESEFTRIGAAQNDSMTINVDLPDATTKDSEGWENFIHGLRGAEGTITGLHDPTEQLTEVEIFDIILNREEVVMQYGDLTTQGAHYFEFDAGISGFTKNSDMETPQGYDFSYKVQGKPEIKITAS